MSDDNDNDNTKFFDDPEVLARCRELEYEALIAIAKEEDPNEQPLIVMTFETHTTLRIRRSPEMFVVYRMLPGSCFVLRGKGSEPDEDEDPHAPEESN